MLRFDRSEKSTFFEQLISMPWNHLVVWRSIFIECWVSFFFLLINEDVFLWISRFSVSVRNIIIFPFCFAEDVNSLRGWGGGGGYPRLPRKFSHHDSTVGFFKENEFSCIYTAASWKYLMVAIFCLGISSQVKFDFEAILKMFIVFI